MENKSSLKYYIYGAIALVAIILIVVLSGGKSKSPEINSQAENSENTSATPVTGVTSNSGLIGTWVSAVSGKGLEGSGKVVTAHSTTDITASSDLKLVIQKIENNTAIGTITYTNLCYTIATSILGRPATTKPPQCTNTGDEPARLQVSGNTISYNGETVLSANVSLEATYSGDTISGTFTRTGAYGKVTGTINLVRVK
jgi:hypothetical protein